MRAQTWATASVGRGHPSLSQWCLSEAHAICMARSASSARASCAMHGAEAPAPPVSNLGSSSFSAICQLITFAALVLIVWLLLAPRVHAVEARQGQLVGVRGDAQVAPTSARFGSRTSTPAALKLGRQPRAPTQTIS